MSYKAVKQAAGEAKKYGNVAKKAGLLSGKQSRIGNGMAILLVSIAGIFDLFSLIPIVGDIVGPIFWISFSIYLWRVGCGFLNTKRLATEIVSFFVELIPGFQALPTIFICTIIIILFVRIEERTGLSVMKSFAAGDKKPFQDASNQIAEDLQYQELQERAANENGRREPGPDINDIAGVRNPNSQPLNTDGVRQRRGSEDLPLAA